MSVFISYSREPSYIASFASKLNGVLKQAKYKVFFDKENLRPPDIWLEAIDKEINKADIFIVLFSKENKKDETNGFFDAEVTLIEYSCKRRINKSYVIPVLFPSVQGDDLPPFFRPYQATPYRPNEDILIVEIKEALRKIKDDRRKKLVTITLLLLLLVPLIFFLVRNMSYGKELCESFEGTYKLHQRYIFKDKDDYRIVTTKNKAQWEDVKCAIKNNNIILAGYDKTDFEIESVIEGKFETIATVLYSYPSKVYLDKNMKTGKRSFGGNDQNYINERNQLKTQKELADNEKLVFLNKNKKGEMLAISDEYKRKKVETAIKDLNENFTTKQPHDCDVTIGDVNGKTGLAFICQEYIRLMVKD